MIFCQCLLRNVIHCPLFGQFMVPVPGSKDQVPSCTESCKIMDGVELYRKGSGWQRCYVIFIDKSKKILTDGIFFSDPTRYFLWTCISDVFTRHLARNYARFCRSIGYKFAGCICRTVCFCICRNACRLVILDHLSPHPPLPPFKPPFPYCWRVSGGTFIRAFWCWQVLATRTVALLVIVVTLLRLLSL